MRVVHPSVYKKQYERGRKGRRRRIALAFCMVMLVVVYGGLSTQVQASYTAQTYDVSIGRQLVNLPWPTVGSASVGYTGSTQVIAQFNGSKQLPSASTIKMLTALVLLESRPLVGEGEEIVFDDNDIARFNEIQAVGGSVFLVPAGTSITYKRALELMVVTSANNIADKLAQWSFGSSEAFLKAATVYAADNGLNDTALVDASGLSAETKSSADDLLRIGLLAMQVPALKEMVALESVPLANGLVAENTNQLLGAEGYNGLKTGYTDEAGACLISSKETTVGGMQIQAVVVVMGQPDRNTAYAVSRQIMDRFLAGFLERSMLNKNQSVGVYNSPWGTKTPIVVSEPVLVVSYEGTSVSGVSSVEKSIGPKVAGTKVGTFRVNNTEADLTLAEDVPPPSISWRLRNVIDYIREKV